LLKLLKLLLLLLLLLLLQRVSLESMHSSTTIETSDRPIRALLGWLSQRPLWHFRGRCSKGAGGWSRPC
jgi:hypothetical protein